MKKFMSKVSLIIVLAMIVSLVAACGEGDSATTTTTAADQGQTTTEDESSDNGGDSELSGEITHWVWGDYEQKGAVDFPDYYPNIKVEYVAVPSDEYTTKLQSTVASGATMPDVVNFEMTPRGLFVSMDAWERLDAEPYNMKTDDLVSWVIPLISNPDGEVVSSQIDNCVGGIVYDRALAIEYFGTDDPEEMEALFPNLDAFVEAGKEIVSKSGGEHYLFSGLTDAFSTISALHTSEPLVIDETKLNIEPTFEPTYNYLAQFVSDGSVGPYIQWTPAWNGSFTSGNVVFYGGPSWFLTFALKANDTDSEGRWALMTPPGGGFSWGGTAYAIPKNAPDENKMLAWTYIEWFTLSMEGAKSFVREQNTPTLYQPAYETDIYAPNPDPFFGGQDVISKLLEISENPNTQTRPMTKYDQSIMDSNTAILNEIELGMSAADAIEALKDDVISKNPELSR